MSGEAKSSARRALLLPPLHLALIVYANCGEMMADFNPDKIPQFFRVKPEDVNLKFVFDNIRNLGLSALLYGIGVIVAKGGPISSLFSLPWSQIVMGVAICISAFVLATLNFMQGILAILATKKLNLPLYLALSLLLHFTVFEVFFNQAFRIINN